MDVFYLSRFEGMMLWQPLFDKSACFENFYTLENHLSCRLLEIFLYNLFWYYMDFKISGVIQGFLAKLNCFLDSLVRGKCLSNTSHGVKF